MKGNCGECEYRYVCEIDPDECDEWPDPAPITNADRIRAMSDDELVQALCDMEHVCNACEVAGTMIACDPAYCRKATIEWLQQPAEGE